VPRRKPQKRSYGSGSVFQQKGRSTWSIKWREEGNPKPRYKHGFLSREEAQTFLDEVIVPNLRAGKPGLPTIAEVRGAQTLSCLAEKWFENRRIASVQNEQYSWKNHLEPEFGHLTPQELGSPVLNDWILTKLGAAGDMEEDEAEDDGEEGQLSPATVKNLVALVSTFYTYLVDSKIVDFNPAKTLPTSTKRRLKSDHDPSTTPFVRDMKTVFAIIATLPDPVSVAYAIGALAGLRTGEILGLDWAAIDLDSSQPKIHVRQQLNVRCKLTYPKSKKARTVLIGDGLLPILKRWRARTGGTGMLFAPIRQGWCVSFHKRLELWIAQWDLPAGSGKTHAYKSFDSEEKARAHAQYQAAQYPVVRSVKGGQPGRAPKYIRRMTLHKRLEEALKKLSVPELTWYQATRHTFASQWAISGGKLRELQRLLGHASITTTERYAHLAPDFFNPDDYKRLGVDPEVVPAPIPSPGGVALSGPIGVVPVANVVPLTREATVIDAEGPGLKVAVG
jgi:integrase